MAVSASFKQQCPSCEALVPIKDGSLVGKKVDCPKCKYRFVVEDPVAKDKKAVAGDKAKRTAETVAKKKETAVMAKANGQAKKAPDDDDVIVAEAEEDDDGVIVAEAEEDDAAPAKSKAKTNGKAPPVKDATKRIKDPSPDDEDDSPRRKKKKKKAASGGNMKLLLTLGVAAIGLVVLGVAALFITGVIGGGAPKQAVAPPPKGGGGGGNPDPIPDLTPKDPKKDPPKKPLDEVAKVAFGPPAGIENTNFLPRSSEAVFHCNFKDLLDSPIGRVATETPGAFTQKDFRQHMGINILAVDDILTAENYTERWTFHVIHSTEQVTDMRPLEHALGLKPWKGSKHACFEVTKNGGWVLALTKLSLFVPAHMRNAQPVDAAARPLLLHLRDPQTLIFAHVEPMSEYLRANGKIEPHPANLVPRDSGTSDPKPGGGNPGSGNPGSGDLPKVDPIKNSPDGQPPDRGGPDKKGPPDRPPPDGKKLPDGDPKQPPDRDKQPPDKQPGGDKQPDPQPKPQDDPTKSLAFLTIKPGLRDMLLRMEVKSDVEKVLFASATHLRAALILSPNLDDFGKITFRTRPIWDVVNLLDEKDNRLEYGGMSFIQRELAVFAFNHSLTCNTDTEAKKLQKDLTDGVAPEVIQFFKKVVSHNVELIKDEPAVKAPGDGQPGGDGRPPMPFPPQPGDGKDKVQPKKDEVKGSRIKVTLNDKVVDFNLDLVLTGEIWLRAMKPALELMVLGMRADVEVAGGKDHRFELAHAGKVLGEKGLSKQNVPPETFPPGAFPRPITAKRINREPGNRVSWMAGLLPYMGHQRLYDRINFEQAWHDEENWLAARTLVPQFLDPTFPITSHYSGHPRMPLDAAATHYVGIGGIGIDAAEARADDPLYAGKLGVFGYDRMTSLDKIAKGRGLSNTVLMIRVPYDGASGPTPWMAGGGSTVRNVPDKNSLEPFLSTDAKGERYTYVVMTDGSVRKIMKGMKDEVFKAICTVEGPTADELSLDTEAPKLPEPKKEPEWAPKGKVVPPPTGTSTGQPPIVEKQPKDTGKGGKDKGGKDGGSVRPKDGGGDYLVVTADDLGKEWLANAETMTAKYKGKKLRVSGEFLIKLEGSGIKTLALKTDSFKPKVGDVRVVAHFQDGSIDELWNSFKAGQPLTIEGTFLESQFNPEITNCRLLK